EFVAEDSIPMGRWKEALTSADLDREIGQRIGSQDRMAWAEFSRTWALHVGGDLEASSAAARDGLAIAERIGDQRLCTWMAASQARVQMDLGNPEAAREAALDAVRRSREVDQIVLTASAYGAMAHVQIAS